MNIVESSDLLIRVTDHKMRSHIQILSETDVWKHLAFTSKDYWTEAFLQTQWEIRDFDLLMEFGGNLDAPLK